MEALIGSSGRRIAVWIWCGILAGFAFGCSPGSSDRATVRIAYLPVTHALLAEELRQSSPPGIEPVKYGSWPDLLDALNTGRVDAALVLIESAMTARAQGIPLRALALGHREGNAIVVARDLPDAGALRGKTFAIPHRLSSHHILYRDMLARNGISEKEVRLIELSPAEMPSALATGRIAGYCVAEPFGAVAVHGGYGRVLYQASELWPDSLCCALVVNEAAFRRHPERLEQLTAAVHAAGKRLAVHERSLTFARRLLKPPETVLRRSLAWISFGDLRITPQAYAALTERLGRYGILKKVPSYEDFVVPYGEVQP